jgi:GrpB-like predicted nucleotidyltransferase (UPF0157 family)
MKKTLSEMSLDELWLLFPIILKEHNPAYKEWYQAEKEYLLNCLEGINIPRINHIGSTAVSGLTAKPTVDILLEVDIGCNLRELKDRLICTGWLLMHSEYDPYRELVFNKGYAPGGFSEKVYHLHARYYGDWDELYFRDYLINHGDIADEYGELKKKLREKYEHDRDGYTESKTEFIKKHTEAARTEFGNRYKPDKG